MSKEQKIKYLFIYRKGINAFLKGEPDINPYGRGTPLEQCAWSAGYFDCKRGLV